MYFSKTNRLRFLLYVFKIVGGVYATLIFFGNNHYYKDNIELIAGSIILLYLFGVYIQNYLKNFVQHERNQFAEKVKADPERQNYCLYLKSFKNRPDIIVPGSISGFGGPTRTDFNINNNIAFEDLITYAVDQNYQLVSLNPPKDDKAEDFDNIFCPGNIVTTDNDWENNFKILAENAHLIFIYPGNATPGLMMEIKFIISNGLLCKCVFIMPPIYLSKKDNRGKFVQDWETAARYLDNEMNVILPKFDNRGALFRINSFGCPYGLNLFPLYYVSFPMFHLKYPEVSFNISRLSKAIKSVSQMSFSNEEISWNYIKRNMGKHYLVSGNPTFTKVALKRNVERLIQKMKLGFKLVFCRAINDVQKNADIIFLNNNRHLISFKIYKCITLKIAYNAEEKILVVENIMVEDTRIYNNKFQKLINDIVLVELGEVAWDAKIEHINNEYYDFSSITNISRPEGHCIVQSLDYMEDYKALPFKKKIQHTLLIVKLFDISLTSKVSSKNYHAVPIADNYLIFAYYQEYDLLVLENVELGKSHREIVEKFKQAIDEGFHIHGVINALIDKKDLTDKEIERGIYKLLKECNNGTPKFDTLVNRK